MGGREESACFGWCFLLGRILLFNFNALILITPRRLQSAETGGVGGGVGGLMGGKATS